jgi:hypothetical protein
VIVATSDDGPVDELVRPQAPVGRPGAEPGAAELEIPRPRWWPAIAALVLVVCSVLAAVLAPIRVSVVATPLHTSSDTISAVVWTTRPPESLLDRTVHLEVRGVRLDGRVRTATSYTAPDAHPADGTTGATAGVLIEITVPAGSTGASPSRIEVDLGRQSLFTDFLE